MTMITRKRNSPFELLPNGIADNRNAKQGIGRSFKLAIRDSDWERYLKALDSMQITFNQLEYGSFTVEHSQYRLLRVDGYRQTLFHGSKPIGKVYNGDFGDGRSTGYLDLQFSNDVECTAFIKKLVAALSQPEVGYIYDPQKKIPEITRIYGPSGNDGLQITEWKPVTGLFDPAQPE